MEDIGGANEYSNKKTFTLLPPALLIPIVIYRVFKDADNSSIKLLIKLDMSHIDEVLRVPLLRVFFVVVVSLCNSNSIS